MTTFQRTIRLAHAWAGAFLALLVLLSCLTGTLLVWKQDYVRLTTPAARVDFEPTLEALAAIANAVEARYAPDDILVIELPTSAFPLTKVRLADTRYAYLDTRGNVIDEWFQNERWEEWLYDLHHRLLLGDAGLTLVGLAALALIPVVIAGLVTFWPLRRGLRLGFWPRGSARPQLLAAHRNLGLIEALPLLLTLMTGAVLVFPDAASRLFLEPFRGEDYSLDFAENLDPLFGEDTGDWLSVMQRAQQSFPGARIRTAQVPNGFSPYRIAGMQQPGELHPEGLSKVYIVADGGWMDVRIDSQAQHVSERLYNTAYPLHTGRFESLTYRVLLTLSGLLAGGLAALGLYCFVRKFRTAR